MNNRNEGGRTRERFFGPRDGNTLIEISLCFMLLMTIFLGIMEFGWGIYNYNFLAYAAREGARYASIRGAAAPTAATAESVRTFVRNQAVVIDATQISVNTTWTPDNTPGNTVTVNISYQVPALLGWLAGGNTITASSTMRIAQ